MAAIIRLIILASILYGKQLCIPATAFTPQFPQMFDVTQIDGRKFHIIAETVTEDGYETTEEFIDFDLGKATHIRVDQNGQFITHVDANQQLIYQYKPYICVVLKPGVMESTEKIGLWSAKTNFNDKDRIKKDMHVYGIAAVWINALEMPKTYTSDVPVVYSASKDVYRAAHKWTIEDEQSSELISFFFIDNSIEVGTKLSLEMIQVEDKKTKKLLKTLNILAMDTTIPEDVYDKLLQVPIGYGCSNLELTSALDPSEIKSLREDHLGSLFGRSHRIELEATAINYESNSGEKKDDQRTISDTIGVELVRTHFLDILGENNLQLIRHQDSRKDVKRVFNYQYHVQYEIDLRKGNCAMSNMKKFSQEEEISLEFSGNNLALNMDLKTMNSLFVEMDHYFYIKRTNKDSSFRDYIYFEKYDNHLFEGKISRIIRAYSSSTRHNGAGDIKLESVTIWVFNLNSDRILESYHLNIIDTSEIESELELGKLFDVSEECYLNNELMKSGRDFAWFELTYPVSSRYGDLLSSSSYLIKEQLYRLINHGHLGLFRAPRMELMFTDFGFIVRGLLLDIPPIHLMYDANPDTVFTADKSEGDLEEIAADIGHCSELCMFYKCKTMSFCETNHICLLSIKLPDHEEGKRKLVIKQSCKTYTLPQDELVEFENMFQLSLHNQLSKLQHQEYRDVVVPKIPDELILPKSETDLDSEQRAKLIQDYTNQLYKFIADDPEGRNSPQQTYLLNLNDQLVVLVPNKFELEDDPLEDFDLSDKVAGLDGNDDQSSVVPAFHEGWCMFHYKINMFNNDGSNKRKAKLFSGLNYDQCSLACQDSRCSSFSYCFQRQECIITDIYDISSSLQSSASLVEQDLDCFIAQRDFLSKFHKFPQISKPNIYKKTSLAYNPSECAYMCMMETEFNCLAFDYCEPSSSVSIDQFSQSELATCFYSNTNLVSDSNEISQRKVNSGSSDNNDNQSKQTQSGCDHYSRSSLANFYRIQYRKIKDEELIKLKSTTFEGRTVDRCANICLNELTDCSAFQFCFDTSKLAEGKSMQSCVLIESKAKGLGDTNAANYQIVLTNNTQSGEIVSAGSFIVASDDCHLFSLRKDSSEAHLRDLALNSMTVDDVNRKKNEDVNESSGSLSIGGGILLYFCLTLVSAAFGCGVCIAKHRSDYVRQRIERVQMLLGF